MTKNTTRNYTSTKEVIVWKKELRWYKEQMAKLKKLVKLSEKRLQQSLRSDDTKLEEYQLKLNKAYLERCKSVISNLQGSIQRSRQHTYDNAKKHSELTGKLLAKVKEEMLEYNNRQISEI